MSRTLEGMKCLAAKATVLEKIKENRAAHATIVKEARAGYVARAKQALNRRLGDLEEGKLLDLRFNIHMPQDHTPDYDTVIEMLSLHQEEFIELTAEQVQCFVRDDWQWKRDFLYLNAAYSNSAKSLLAGSEWEI